MTTEGSEESTSDYSRVQSESEAGSRVGALTGISQCTDSATAAMDYDDFTEYETFEECMLAFAQALKDKGFIPSWIFWQKACSYLADHYDDAPAKDAKGQFTRKVKLLKDQVLVAVYGPEWKKLMHWLINSSVSLALILGKLEHYTVN